MDRRNFFRSMIGGVAAAAAVRTFPFRVFSFPTDLRILNPVVSQTLYHTVAGGNNYIKVGDVMALELENVAEEIPDLIRNEATLYSKIRKPQMFTVTGIVAENTITIENIPRTPWKPWPNLTVTALDPHSEEDTESARTINKLMDMGLLK